MTIILSCPASLVLLPPLECSCPVFHGGILGALLQLLWWEEGTPLWTCPWFPPTQLLCTNDHSFHQKTQGVVALATAKLSLQVGILCHWKPEQPVARRGGSGCRGQRWGVGPSRWLPVLLPGPLSAGGLLLAQPTPSVTGVNHHPGSFPKWNGNSVPESDDKERNAVHFEKPLLLRLTAFWTICICVCACCAQWLSQVWLFATLWTIARQAPLSIGFSRILEWVAMPSSRGSSRPRDQTCISCTADGLFLAEPLGKPSIFIKFTLYL